MDPESLADFFTAFTPVFVSLWFAVVLALDAGGPEAVPWVYAVMVASACCFLEGL